MTQFREGQEVEVLCHDWNWHKAKIVHDRAASGHAADGYEVQFPDGTNTVFDAEHIRTAKSDFPSGIADA